MKRSDAWAYLAQKYHDRPIPACTVRMNRMDALPKEIRECIHNLQKNPGDAVDRAHSMLKARKSIKAIIKYLKEQDDYSVSSNPAEREAAQAFLKELGL